MRSIYPLVAAACLLAAPLAPAAQCGGYTMVNIHAQRASAGDAGGFIATGTQLLDEVVGSYALSNGHHLTLLSLDQQLYAEFDHRRRVRLQEIGAHHFATRERDVHMVWMPGQRTDTILLSYPADSRGRLRRQCS